MKKPRSDRLRHIIARFNKVKILVLGDLILDNFIWGDVSRISPEAPVPVVQMTSESFAPGGASNAAANIQSLGGKSAICGVVGGDFWGNTLAEELEKRGVDTTGIFADSERPTTLKTRIIAHKQQVVRVDREKEDPLGVRATERIVECVRSRISEFDALLIEDYGKGVITPRILKPVITLARQKKKIITVDPKEEHFDLYRGVTVITPNQAEAGMAVKMNITDEESMLKVGKLMLKTVGAEAVLITRGKDGMCLFGKNSSITAIPTVAREVFDVTGAGDTVISAFTLSLAAGATMEEAAYISNFAAGIVVGKIGVATVTAAELKKALGC